MNGVETLPHLEHLQPSVPILLSSGYDELVAGQQFAAHDLADFIQKPYTAAGLARRIKQVLEPSIDSPPNVGGR